MLFLKNEETATILNASTGRCFQMITIGNSRFLWRPPSMRSVIGTEGPFLFLNLDLQWLASITDQNIIVELLPASKPEAVDAL